MYSFILKCVLLVFNMDRFIIQGGKKLEGEVTVSGAKNIALKALVAACLTEEDVTIQNVPLISDFFVMVDLIKELGGKVTLSGHTATVSIGSLHNKTIPLEKAAEVRTSSMLMAPLLARSGKAVIPNPGGCRIGARPIDRTIEGLNSLGANVLYNSEDGYFYANSSLQGPYLKGNTFRFDKNTHTGTETLIIASTLAKGTTVIENAAEEPEIDELIGLLTSMGAHIKRVEKRTIIIEGVQKLHGATFRISPDRNEVVTFAIAALITKGDILVKEAQKESIEEFLEKLQSVGGGYEIKEKGIRFFPKTSLSATDIVTTPYPGFMTDWQAPWAVLMTQAKGESIVHETVYESRFGYVRELLKMGAKIEFFDPEVSNPQEFYNFNISDDKEELRHAIKISGPTPLHNAVVSISDLRAGATLVLASLAARGESVVFGVSHLDRGYENFDKRLKNLGADIKRVYEE